MGSEREDLLERLKAGCVVVGEGDNGIELYDVEGANDDMSDAAAALSAQEEQIERLRKALARLLLEFDFLVEGGDLPDIRNDIIFDAARAALSEVTDGQ